MMNKIKNFYYTLKKWFSYYKVIKKQPFDFDYSSILDVERHQLIRVRNCIKLYHHHLYWKKDVERINLALRLLDIIEEQGCSKRIGKSLLYKVLSNDLYELKDDPNSYYIMPIYVNTRNYKRFKDKFNPKEYEDKRFGGLWKDDLRIEKAWYLYHKLQLYYLRTWWD